eukprot:CAMPEP_0178416558 /NCGR_PEP_ID=MMETSP0689_2-20121128/24125_1 /TAXON_ID=160604 /ORGANISM="Amphidinium massartii, Strain CS-259" /LENGTH=211 /DNA_ID=CAMNT_0020037905 /DNA_START=147 /DNA_END=782 /DNA_ORIENTATION=+
MVDALLFLQGHTVRIQELGSEVLTKDRPEFQPLLLLAAGYCNLLGYKCEGTSSRRLAGGEPHGPEDYLAAFSAAVKYPDQFLQDLLTLKAQLLPAEKVHAMKPLTEACERCAQACRSNNGEVLRQLAAYLRGCVECAEIYVEIRESGASGLLNAKEVASWLESAESDQKRMIGAMGHCQTEDDSNSPRTPIVSAAGISHAASFTTPLVAST